MEVLLEFKTFIHEDGNPFTPLHCALSVSTQGVLVIHSFNLVSLHLKSFISYSASALRMNGHSGAAERLLESAGAYMLNTRDAKGR